MSKRLSQARSPHSHVIARHPTNQISYLIYPSNKNQKAIPIKSERLAEVVKKPSLDQ